MQEHIWRQVKLLGGNSNAFDAWLLLREYEDAVAAYGKTCAECNQSGSLSGTTSNVKQVYYAGSKNHPQYKLAKKQMKNGGAMLSFELKAD